MVIFLIIGNIFKIHAFFYVFMFICLITGNIRDYLIFTSIIVIHELGHVFGGIIFSWKINKIILLPFGGLTIFDVLINTSLFEQFIVTLLGPLFQVVFFFIINYYFCLSDRLVFFNYVLLFFNLLPIFPLDGSKFFYIFCCFLLPFRFSYYFLLFVSLIFILFIFVFVGKFDLLVFLILIFLLISCVKEFMNFRFVFNKFLFERYYYDLKFSHIKGVSSIAGMFLWCGHLFFSSDGFVTEREKLLKMFDKRY